MTMDRAMRTPQRPTMDDYGDHELFGPRIASNKSLARLKAGNDSECVIFAIGTFAGKEKYKLTDLIGTDRRLRQMVQGLDIKHALPVQRYAWPKIHQSTFANVFVSPEATGKSHALLLYLMSKCISAAPINEAEELLNSETSNQYAPTDHTDLEEFIVHPKYIIISSSQDNVDMLSRKIDLMKQQAYGHVISDAQRRLLTPIARTINIHQDNDKLALRCNESEIIISSPPALLKCLNEGHLNFAKCRKVFFDDLDIALQLQNSTIREIIKIFLVQSGSLPGTSSSADPNAVADEPRKPTCQMYMFSRKWTDLVSRFVSCLFSQRILLFASVAEAAIYKNVRFEVETYEDDAKRVERLANSIANLADGKAKVAVVCRTDEEAEAVWAELAKIEPTVRLIREENTETPVRQKVVQRTPRDLLFVMSDSALEFEVEYSTRRNPLNDITHLIHASLPEEMLTFDQRFRVLYKNIQDSRPAKLSSTIMLSQSLKSTTARQIYDLISRSEHTLPSTKLLMRDFLANQSSKVCWRWATTGLCRLEKLSREDRFGSYCFDRHSLPGQTRGGNSSTNGTAQRGLVLNRWPREGLVRITITHIVSPSEFYFWFESAKSIENGVWNKFKESGKAFMRDLRAKLDALKDTQSRSVPLEKIKKGRVYGVHFPQECRVDRVLLLDDLELETKRASMINKDLEYSRQVRVFKVDYGSRLEVFVRNLIELPEELRATAAQSHRGLHLGYRPTDGEPNWPYKSKKQFYESVCANQEQTVSAWLRLNGDGCFWLESLLVSRKLSNIDSQDVDTFNPLLGLKQLGLAESTSAEPSGLPPSSRARAYLKWEQATLGAACQFAFLDRDAPSTKVFLLDVKDNLDVLVRSAKFNRELIDLEDELLAAHVSGSLDRQELIEPGTICLASVASPGAPINRVRITRTFLEEAGDIESPDESTLVRRVVVECLDHGDIQTVRPEDIFKARLEHVRRLPFQALRLKLANVNPSLVADAAQVKQLKNELIELARDQNNMNLVLLCRLNARGEAYLYLPQGDQKVYLPLYMRLQELNCELHLAIDSGFEQQLEQEEDSVSVPDQLTNIFDSLVADLLRDMAQDEMEMKKQRDKTRVVPQVD